MSHVACHLDWQCLVVAQLHLQCCLLRPTIVSLQRVASLNLPRSLPLPHFLSLPHTHTHTLPVSCGHLQVFSFCFIHSFADFHFACRFLLISLFSHSDCFFGSPMLFCLLLLLLFFYYRCDQAPLALLECQKTAATTTTVTTTITCCAFIADSSSPASRVPCVPRLPACLRAQLVEQKNRPASVGDPLMCCCCCCCCCIPTVMFICHLAIAVVLATSTASHLAR